MWKRRGFPPLAAMLLMLAASPTVQAFLVNVGPADIGTGIYASATVAATAGAGFLDVVVTNTSPLGPVIDGQYANAFITEVTIPNLEGFTLDEENSYVSSFPDTWFSQAGGNPALQLGERHLSWSIGTGPPAKKTWVMSLGAGPSTQGNDNSIASINVLDSANVPQEGWAVGFLNTSPDIYSGAVFDSARFFFKFLETETPSDLDFYAIENSISVKFAGGGYSSRLTVPEPATIIFLALSSLSLLRKGGRRNRIRSWPTKTNPSSSVT